MLVFDLASCDEFDVEFKEASEDDEEDSDDELDEDSDEDEDDFTVSESDVSSIISRLRFGDWTGSGFAERGTDFERCCDL